MVERLKRCFKCGNEKAIGEFYKHAMMSDGRLNKCKDCAKKDVSDNRIRKIHYYRSYDRARASTPKRVALRARVTREHREKYPHIKKAQTALSNAIRDKMVIPWPVCAIPECDGKPEAHHPDYSRPLDVVWLCPAHHKQAHALLRKAA